MCAVYQYALYYYSQATQHVIIITSCCPLLSLHGHTTDTRCDTHTVCLGLVLQKSFYPACLAFFYVISTLYFICFTSKRKRFCFHLWEFSPESTSIRNRTSNTKINRTGKNPLRRSQNRFCESYFSVTSPILDKHS